MVIVNRGNEMDFMTGTVLSGVVYDVLKNKILISGSDLKIKLKNWLVSDFLADELVRELNKLGLSRDMSEYYIENKINNSIDMVDLIKQIRPKKTININQEHSGFGDNVGRDKKIIV